MALAVIASAACLLLLPAPADAFAAWFVDRRVSCMTDLAPNEIIMNQGVIQHSVSREKGISIEVSPLESGGAGAGAGGDDSGANAKPNAEYVVKFVVPDDARGRLDDVQYVLELAGSGEGESYAAPPAKFTTAPSGGGIGCEDRRTHGKYGKDGDDSANIAIFQIDENAAVGSRFEVVGGWATGHESVTLTRKVAVVVGEGIVREGAGSGGGATTTERRLEADYAMMDDRDDAMVDDEAEAELEEAFIEEEREELDGEIEEAEEDAVEALEEKRQEAEGLGGEINDAEEGIVEAFEENRKHVDQALDALKDEIMLKQADKSKERLEKHAHNLAERREAQRKHVENHKRKHLEDRLGEMQRRFADARDERKDKLDELMDARGALKDHVEQLHRTTRGEHDRARKEHLKPLPKEELRVDMEELKRKARERMSLLSDKLGVNELLNDPRLKKMHDKLKPGLIRGGGAAYNRDKGQPLPPEGRHFLMVMFSLFAGVGLVRWYLDKRRRVRKGRRTL